MIFFGEDSLRKATRESVAHYHSERNHQGLAIGSLFQSNPSRQRREGSAGDNGWAACSITTTETRRDTNSGWKPLPSTVRIEFLDSTRSAVIDRPYKLKTGQFLTTFK